MADARHHEWPDDEALVALILEVGSVIGTARRLGLHNSTLRQHLDRRGLTERVRAEMKGRTLAPAPDAEDDGQVSEVEVLRAQVVELRANARKERKTDVQSERIVQAVEQALREIPAPVRQKPVKATATTRGAAHHRQLVLLSDFHGGEVVDPEVLNGLNAYNWEIMEARVDELIASLISHKRNSPELTGLDVAFLGDMCSGSNHLELAISNEFGMAEQGVRMGALMGQIIERLVPHYANLRVLAVEGNHPRLSQKPAAKSPHDNFDWVAAIFAKQYLSAYPSVTFTVGRGSIRHSIAGRVGYFFHGDGIRSSMPGVPFGGVMRRVNVLQSQYNERIDFYAYGHFHTATIVQGGRIIGNGSLKGPDEWTQKNFGGGDRPAQWLLTFDEKASRMTEARLITPTAGIPDGG